MLLIMFVFQLIFFCWLLKISYRIDRIIRIMQFDSNEDSRRIVQIKALVHKIFSRDLQQMLDDIK